MTYEEQEKETLEIEKLKQDIRLDLQRFDLQLKSIWLDGTKLAFYALAVGAGLMLAYAKIIGV